jgi:hypothetical protein
MFASVIEVAHGDGSHFIFQNADAKVKKIKGTKMLLVWSEHCTPFSSRIWNGGGTIKSSNKITGFEIF